MIFRSSIETTRFAPIIQDIKNQTVGVGGRLTVECRAVARKQPEFNLVELLPDGSLVPVEIGEKIKRRLVQPQDVRTYVANFLRRDSLYANIQGQIHVFQKLLINIHLQYICYIL